jgi:flagellar motor switch protein FliM
MEDKVTQGWNRTHRQPTALEQSRLHANLGRVPLEVSTSLATEIGARELLALQRGDVLALGHSANAPVAVHVGGVHRFNGRLTLEGRSAAVLIEQATNVKTGTELTVVGAV